MATKKHVFSSLEKKSFSDILKKYSHIIENKDTNGATLRAKNKAWDSVTKEYNAHPHATHQVTNKQLRRLWMNLKQRQREALTKERLHRVATGGGPSAINAKIDPDVSEVAPALIVGIEEAIDSDTIPELSEIPIYMETETQPLSTLNTSSQTPSTSAVFVIPATSQPRTILTPSLPPNVRTPPTSQSTPPSISSTSVASFQRQKISILEKEFRDRQRRADELHELEIELMKHRIREAKAKADLAGLKLRQELSTDLSKREQEDRE